MPFARWCHLSTICGSDCGYARAVLSLEQGSMILFLLFVIIIQVVHEVHDNTHTKVEKKREKKKNIQYKYSINLVLLPF